MGAVHFIAYLWTMWGIFPNSFVVAISAVIAIIAIILVFKVVAFIMDVIPFL